MAFYSRRYRRRWRPRYRVRRYWRRRWRKFINGSSKSTVRMKTAVEGNFKVTSGANGVVGDAAASVIAFARSNNPANAMSVLNSPLYRTYTNLYDQVKCLGMKVSVSIVDAIGGADLPSVQIYTSWDRQKLGQGDPAPTGPEMKNASTYNVATALNNNVAKITRSLYASDLMEKAMWHDCTLDHHEGDPDDPADPEYWDDKIYKNAVQLPFFSPAFFMAIATPTLAAAKQVSVACSVVYYMAFRNPKYGASASLGTREDLGARRLVRPDDDDGDMQPPAQRMAAASASGRVVPAAAAAAAVDDPPELPDMDDDSMQDSGRHPHKTVAQSQRLN